MNLLLNAVQSNVNLIAGDMPVTTRRSSKNRSYYMKLITISRENSMGISKHTFGLLEARRRDFRGVPLTAHTPINGSTHGLTNTTTIGSRPRIHGIVRLTLSSEWVFVGSAIAAAPSDRGSGVAPM